MPSLSYVQDLFRFIVSDISQDELGRRYRTGAAEMAGAKLARNGME